MSNSHATPRVLLVEDDELAARSQARKLELEGIECVVAGGVREALERLEAGGIDLVVTDLHLDSENGIDLLRRLPPRARLLPVIVITGMPTLESAVEALRLSVVDYVLKPVTDLPARVRQALDRAAARRALLRSEDALREWSTWVEQITGELHRVREAFVSEVLPDRPTARSGPDLSALSDREQEIVGLVARGLSNKEIGAKLFISEQTVKNHLKATFRKLSVRSRTELIARLNY